MAEFSVFTRQVTFLALCSLKYVVARVGSVSVWFRPSKDRPRNGFSVLAAQKMERERKNERGGRGRKKTADKPPPRSFTRPIFSRGL